MKFDCLYIFALCLLMQKGSLFAMDAPLTLSIVGFGSPIVDGVINYEVDLHLSEKMKKVFQYHMSDDLPVEFYNEVFSNKNMAIQLGGSAMNTIRGVNYLLQLFREEKDDLKFKVRDKVHSVGVIGSIGADANGDKIKVELQSEGVISLLEEFGNERTATNIVLVEKLDRHLYTDLGASDKITLQHFQSFSHILSNLEIFYADAYLVGKRFECYKYFFANETLMSNVTLALSMASQFTIQEFYDNLQQIFPFLDYIFINSDELETLKLKVRENNTNNHSEENFSNNIEFMVNFLKQIDKRNKEKKTVMINTRSKDDVLLVSYDYVRQSYVSMNIPIIDLDRSRIVDLNGAGDAFAAGFLAGLISGLPLEDCAYMGNRLASEIIQLRGFQLPQGLKAESFFEFKTNIIDDL